MGIFRRNKKFLPNWQYDSTFHKIILCGALNFFSVVDKIDTLSILWRGNTASFVGSFILLRVGIFLM